VLATPPDTSAVPAPTFLDLWPGAAVGTVCGWIVGFLMYGYHCVVTAASYDCGPLDPQGFKILLVTVAGAMAGLLVWRLRRSMTNTQKTLMMAAISILLVVLAVAWIIRITAWSCPEGAFCAPNSGAT
jgi:hypothetical protein